MKEQIALEPIRRETCVVKETHKNKGRSLSVAPGKTASRNLHYGRIILDAGDAPLAFETATRETGLICLNGSANIVTGDDSFTLNRYDAVYIPRDSGVTVSTDGGCDLAEVAAPVEKQYPIQFVSFAEVRNDPALHFMAGKPPIERDLNILLGKNVDAGRIMAGVTFSTPGNWTSWPPHEHAAMLEELYVYYDMPAPAFGVQFVYTDAEEPEFVGVVRDGDAVVMPKGFHPNVSVPGHTISFVWLMAAHREVEDRQFGVVTVQPGFDREGTGLEASRK